MTLTAEEIEELATPEELAELDALLRTDTPRITLADLMVLDKQTKALVPLLSVLNTPQREVLDQLGIDPLLPLPDLSQLNWRLRILKARREGISTIIAALYFVDTYNHRERNTVVIAHREDSAAEIFSLYKRFYENLPPAKQLKAQREGGGELFWSQTNSRISVATAGSDDVKSGATIHNLHKSEYAKWLGDVAAVDASVNIAAQYGNVIEETTARGLNHFYDKWQESERGGNAYKPLFLPWFADPTNRVKSPPGEYDQVGNLILTDNERQRAETFDLDRSQIAWYRIQQAEYRELTAQEFPHTPREAFVSSGNPVFNRSVLEEWEQRLERVEEIEEPDFRNGRDGYWRRLQDQHSLGRLKVWVPPDKRLHCIVSADPSSGIQRESKKLDFCSASAYVFGDYTPLTQAAQLHGRWEPDEFGWLLSEFASWYNSAMLVVLRLNHGHAVLSTLLNYAHYPAGRGDGWGGVYFHNPAEINEKATDQKPEMRQPGWDESGGGKQFMIATIQSYIREDSMVLNSRQSVNEAFRYVHLPGGGMGAESGNDDTVSELAAACAVFRLRGKYARIIEDYGDEEESEYRGWSSGRRRER